jgi:hypothetical protein
LRHARGVGRRLGERAVAIDEHDVHAGERRVVLVHEVHGHGAAHVRIGVGHRAVASTTIPAGIGHDMRIPTRDE